MAEEIDCANLGLPADFFTEDFFAEKKSCEGGGNPYDWVWNTHTGPDAGEDHFAELTCKMAHYFPLDDEGDRMPSTKSLLYQLSKTPARESIPLFPSALDDKKDSFSGRSAGDSPLLREQTNKAQISAARRRYEVTSQPTWAFATLPHQPARPNTRAKPLGGRRGAGTGVFLPRQPDYLSEPKKTPDVSSVKLSAMPAQEGKRGLYSPAKVGPERFLPADWTY